MTIIIIFLVGVLLGIFVSIIISRFRAVGSLRIDTSDADDSPYLFLELSSNVNEVYKQKYVTLRINTNNFISHK